MPRLPDATALGESPTPQPSMGVVQVQGADQGALGRALVGAGSELQQAAQIISTTNARQDEMVARSAANQFKELALDAEYNPQGGFRNVKGSAVVGQPFVQDYSKRLSEIQTTIRSRLQTDGQRQAFDQYAGVQSLQFKANLLQHQARETEAFNDATDDATAKMALRVMAQNPGNELVFQTQMVEIEGVLASVQQRKKMSDRQVSLLRGTFIDAAYTARITSLMHGIPGVVNADPYKAEAMFRQVQGQLGPTAQVALADQVIKGVKSLQGRDTAKSIIFGVPPTDPKVIEPAVQGPPLTGVQASPVKPQTDVPARDLPSAALTQPGVESAVLSMESGGQRYGKDGKLLTSPKGALGEMQVMPATAARPGYGVTPARDDSPEELARVGRDYLGAMTARYNNPALVMAAYNAGPPTVDKWLSTIGDPRTGQISVTEWASKIPYAETRNYVLKGMSLLANSEQAAGVAQPTAQARPEPLPMAPTAAQLSARLGEYEREARKVAEGQYPGDTAYADSVVAQTRAYANQVIQEQRARESAAQETLLAGSIGTRPDGSDKPPTIEALLAQPGMRAAWDSATPATKAALQQRMGNGDKGFTAESLKTYYYLLGQSVDPDRQEDFLRTDLGQLFGKVPDGNLLELMRLQRSVGAADVREQQKAIEVSRAVRAITPMIKAAGLNPSAKPGTDDAVLYSEFVGRLGEDLKEFREKNNRRPTEDETRKMAAGLLVQGKQAGDWFKTTPAFKADPAGFKVPLPSSHRDKAQVYTKFTEIHKRRPVNEAEVQKWYTQWRLEGNQ